MTHSILDFPRVFTAIFAAVSVLFGASSCDGAGTVVASVAGIASASDRSECPEDINGDGVIDISDLLVVLGAWGPCSGCPADINGDDAVGVGDLLPILAAWGPCSPATGACCFLDESCMIVSESECSQLGGMYLGDGEPCAADDRCPCEVVTEEESKLLGADLEGIEVFGDGVAIDGVRAMVGAPSGNGSTPGATYVFEFDGSTWTETQKFTLLDGSAGDRFGQMIDLEGDLAIVTAPQQLNSGPGYAYAYHHLGSEWIRGQRLFVPGGGNDDDFGRSVCLDPTDPTRVVIGATGVDTNGAFSGAVYVFESSGFVWTLKQELLAPGGSAGDRLGGSVAIEGDLMLVGASGDDNVTGAVHAYGFDGSSWIWQQKITAFDGVAGDGFGVSVSMSGKHAIIGASQVLSEGPGRVYAYEYDGKEWVFDQMLDSGDSGIGDKYGIFTAMKGGVAVIGAPTHDPGVTDAGASYIFQRDGTGWILADKLIASDPGPIHYFGGPVAISSSAALIGAPFDDEKGFAAGAAYVHRGVLDCAGSGGNE